MIDLEFWAHRKVFLTGHTGFKGSWISTWLISLGAIVTGYALKPEPSATLFKALELDKILSLSAECDVRNVAQLRKGLQEAKPEIVIHMAAQALVRNSYYAPVDTFDTNIMGTVNLLEAIRDTPSVKAVLIVTSDKCYDNQEWLWGYRENEAMGGHDPYSSSKACAELVSAAYRHSFLQDKGVALATARAGNVIGGGDWAKDRIVPDAIRAFIDETPLKVRNPVAIRPWQHVLEPLAGYLMLCQKLIQQPQDYAQAWNFGPNDEDVQSVKFLVDTLVDRWGENSRWCLDEDAHPHEANSLKLDCSKAKTQLSWQPKWSLERTLNETVAWYKACHLKQDMCVFTQYQIQTYQREIVQT